MTAYNREQAGLDQSNESNDPIDDPDYDPNQNVPDQPDTQPVPVTEPNEPVPDDNG